MLVVNSVRAVEAPLADAVESKQAAIVGKLLDQKVNVNVPQADGMTALHWATYHDDLDTVKRLVAAGANVKATNRYEVTPLSLACTNGNTAIVELLLESGADANCKLPGGETALMTASRTGKPGPVQALIARKADVNARERKGQTALMWAAADGHLDVVEALLKAGADFHTALPSGFTPLFFAIREGRSAVVFRLLEAGLNVNDAMRPRSGKSYSPLILAIENGHFELAVALLKAGANPNDRPAGYGALHAISWVRKPIRGDGDPPPIGSGTLSSLDVVRALVAHKADVNIRLEHGDSGRGRFTTTGSTPFLLASRTGDVALMKLLLELKADPTLTNADNSTPLLAAAGVGALGDGDEAAATEDEAVAAATMLLDLGADIDAVDKNGETAMHGAAYQSLPKLVKLLAERRADIQVWNRKNKWDWTPLMIAQGHRPGNFRPAPDTIAAIERVMLAANVALPPNLKANNDPDYGQKKRPQSGSHGNMVLKTESFDRDPGWIGVNNRSARMNDPMRIRQDFGYSSKTAHAGGSSPGEIGGFITPAGEAAFYGKAIDPVTFDRPLSASGKLTIAKGGTHLLLGFFNSNSVNEWRTPNTIAIRLNGRGDNFFAYVEYCTSKWRAGGDTTPFPSVTDPQTGRWNLIGYPCNKSLPWTLTYDPRANDGKGALKATIGSDTAICNLDEGHKVDGASFNRFGILNVMKSADSGSEVWFDDVVINGDTVESFDKDPQWDGRNNRQTTDSRIVRPWFDFGFSETHHAGGKAKGELGGRTFRGDCREPHRMACYGDKIEQLTLTKPIKASGKIALRRGVSDSTTLFGFYNSRDSMRSNPSQSDGVPESVLGIHVEGPSSEGFKFYPVLHATGRGNTFGEYRTFPTIHPDGQTHDWSLEYDPLGADGKGRITVTFDGKSGTFDLREGDKASTTTFDRFGIVTNWIDGNSQDIYLDDITYTCAHK